MLNRCCCRKAWVSAEILVKAHPNAESRRGAGHLPVQPELGFAEPYGHGETGLYRQRDRHLNETAAQAQIRSLSPDHRLALAMQFHRNGTLHARRVAAVHARSEVIGGSVRQRKIPKQLFWGEIEQPDLALARRAKTPNPLHAEMGFVLAVAHPMISST